MSETDPRQNELVEWLQGRGHSAEDIDRILAKVAEYDEQTLRESIFDSIDRGNFNLESFIKEALEGDS